MKQSKISVIVTEEQLRILMGSVINETKYQRP